MYYACTYSLTCGIECRAPSEWTRICCAHIRDRVFVCGDLCLRRKRRCENKHSRSEQDIHALVHSHIYISRSSVRLRTGFDPVLRDFNDPPWEYVDHHNFPISSIELGVNCYSNLSSIPPGMRRFSVDDILPHEYTENDPHSSRCRRPTHPFKWQHGRGNVWIGFIVLFIARARYGQRFLGRHRIVSLNHPRRGERASTAYFWQFKYRAGAIPSVGIVPQHHSVFEITT